MQASNIVPDIGRFAHPLTSNILQWFIDRQAILDQFEAMLSGADTKTLVLLIVGPEGIGKTWLLTKLHFEASAKPRACAYIDFGFAKSLDELLLCQRLAQMLGSAHFVKLNSTLTDAATQKVIVVLKTEGSTGPSSINFQGPVEFHRDFAQGDIIKGNIFHLNVDSAENLKDWINRITDAFLTDLAVLGVTSAVGILFDSYEHTSEEARLWINDRLLKSLGEGELGQVRVVFAGEQVPNFPSSWHGLVTELSLNLFSATQVHDYLMDKRNLKISEELISEIYEITQGRPDQVALFADQPDTLPTQLDPERIEEFFISRILEHAPKRIHDALLIAAIPEWFDDQVLAALLEQPIDVDDLLAEMQIYSFVQVSPERRFVFKKKARSVLLAQWCDNPSQLRRIHEHLAQHFEQRALHTLGLTPQMELTSLAISHWLAINEQQGCQLLRILFEQLEQSHALSICETMLKYAEKVNNLSAPTHDLLQFLRGRLAFLRNNDRESNLLLEKLLQDPQLDGELYALSKWCMGQNSAKLGFWSTAIDYYQEALPYFRGQPDKTYEGRVLLSLGEVFLEQAQALGEPVQPRLFSRQNWRGIVAAMLDLLVALPFVVYAWLIRHWRFLPPLHHGMNYRNWSLMRTLLIAAEYFRHAQSHFDAANAQALTADAQRKLAITYYWLGWWQQSCELSEKARDNDRLSANRYHQAQVTKELAVTLLALGDPNRTIQDLGPCLKTFGELHDELAQAETHVLLGRAYLQQGKVDIALAEFKQALDQLSQSGSQYDVGQALDTLRHTVQEVRLTAEQHSQMNALIENVKEKTYLPNVPDKWATGLEYGIWIIVGIGVLAGLALYSTSFIANLITPEKFFTSLFNLNNVARLAGGMVTLLWIIVIVSGVVGLLLLNYSARQQMKAAVKIEDLDRITTTDSAIIRSNFRGEEQQRIDWNDVVRIISVERILWSKPLSLFSRLWIFGGQKPICVPTTIRWYADLKSDIEHHLQKIENCSPWQKLNVHVLQSKLGLLLVLFPILLATGTLIVYNWLPLPMGLRLAEHSGPAFMFAAFFAVTAGPYWWLVLQPLWVRYNLTPQSFMPWVAGICGALIVVFAFVLHYYLPFFPMRQTFDRFIHPLGFLLLISTGLWLFTARRLPERPLAPRAAAYPVWMRAFGFILLMAALVLTLIFARVVWVPDISYTFQGITHFYHQDYTGAVDRFTRLLATDVANADGYSYRGRAYTELGKYDLAIADLGHIIESGEAIATDYVSRAIALHQLGQIKAGCTDLQTALDMRQWSVSSQLRGEIEEKYWVDWRCHEIKDK